MKLISTGSESVYKSWDITHLGYTAYDPEMFWQTVQDMQNGKVITPKADSNYARAIAICTIQTINRKWPTEPDKGEKAFQRDLLAMTVRNVSKYYEKNPHMFFKYCPNLPTTKSLKEEQHRRIKYIASKRMYSCLRPILNDLEKRDYNRVKFLDGGENSEDNRTQEEKINDAAYKPEEVEFTDFDRHIISTDLDQAVITDETIDIISEFYRKNHNAYQAIIPYFQNKVLIGLNPFKLWKMKIFQWKATEVYSLLEKIDEGVEPLNPDEKGYLYLFYLQICVSALEQKWTDSVDIVNYTTFTVKSRFVPLLTNLVIKTFLHFTKDLNTNVFSHIKNPPPTVESDVTAFYNKIKDKPRGLLKSIALPYITLAPPQSNMTNLMKIKNAEELPSSFNLEEVFVSYEVFETLTKNIVTSFMDGEIKDRLIDNTAALSEAVGSMGPEKLGDVIKKVLLVSGYKIEKDNENEGNFVIEGPESSIHVKPEEPSRNSSRFSVSFNCTGEFGKSEIEKAKEYRQFVKTERMLLISTKPYSKDFKELKKTIGSYESWELLDLIEMIQRTYHDMPEEDQKLIDEYLEKALQDF